MIRKGTSSPKGSGSQGAIGSVRFGTRQRVGVYDPDHGGSKPPRAEEASADRASEQPGVARKQQARNFDLAVVAWKRAVTVGERKVAARRRPREESACGRTGRR